MALLTKPKNISYDRIGIFVSLICTIHCLLGPLFFLALPAVSIARVDHEWLHYLFLALAAFAAHRAMSHHPHHRLVKILALTGLTLLIAALVYHEVQVEWSTLNKLAFDPHLSLNLAGSILLIAAHSVHLLQHRWQAST